MSREIITGIYKITNLVNGKMYIGQSIDIYKRWKEHKATSLNTESQAYNYPIYCAFRKYGFENFKFEVIEECSTDKLDEKEIYYIEKYNSYIGGENANGYNLTTGGEGTRGKIFTDEELEQMSQRMKGKLAKGKNPKALKEWSLSKR